MSRGGNKPEKICFSVGPDSLHGWGRVRSSTLSHCPPVPGLEKWISQPSLKPQDTPRTPRTPRTQRHRMEHSRHVGIDVHLVDKARSRRCLEGWGRGSFHIFIIEVSLPLVFSPSVGLGSVMTSTLVVSVWRLLDGLYLQSLSKCSPVKETVPTGRSDKGLVGLAQSVFIDHQQCLSTAERDSCHTLPPGDKVKGFCICKEIGCQSRR